ncbi:hypothetical protein EI71_00924 [Anaeroplasma bactoclasticum]|uniref:Uncharacterized protein n=1 Tax=Anaeroplasma bactoclasticum TaxID=2088 RepID=A0A397S4Y6_9MOLU|nr:hypothetical protein [Anaeroplasma bactoclasticum]RIA77771.1 hypothetical protein EI71_00924 [Anaeroplasma bactoclasticum]
MELNYSKNQIILYGKVCKLDTLINKLSSLSGEQVYHFLIDRTTQLPRRINCMAMISVLNNRIKFLHSNSMPKDAFVKLQYYASYSEQQLFMLFNKICDETDFQTYRKNLFSLIIDNYQELNLNDGELMYLKNLNKQSIGSFPDYFNYITGASLEQDNTFDGQDVTVLKNNLQYSASNQDIFDLAGKYGVPLPQRLKREEYLEFIFDYLKRKGTYSESVQNELNEMNITQISTYARRTGIPMQPNMSKTELITYFFYFLDQCEIPTTSMSEIKSSPKYEPLEFRVDLQAIDSFGTSEPKRVIYYAGDHEDSSEMAEVIKEALKAEEEVQEEIIEETKPVVEEEVETKVVEETPIQPVIEEPKEEEKEENLEEIAPWKFIVKSQEQAKAEEEAILAAKKEEELLAEDIINETLAQIKTKEVQEEVEPTIAIDTNKVEQNPEFGSGKIESLANSKSRLVLLSVSLGVAAAVMIFIVVAMLVL